MELPHSANFSLTSLLGRIMSRPVKIKKNYLLTPGPTPIPAEVALLGALPIIHHRTPQFRTILKEAGEGLKYLFATQNPVYILACSGTGVMEAAVANLVSPGDTVIVVEIGKFGQRWTQIAKAFGLKPVVLSAEYGKVVEPAELEEALKKNPQTKAVFVQLSETSTGCVSNVEAFGKAVGKTEALFVVDGISGVGAEVCYPDKWGIDCLLTGSQKGVMLPPGLGFISLSAKAEGRCEKNTGPRFYFDLRAYKKAYEKEDTPYTPAITLVIQLNEALKIIREETLEGMWRRHAWLAEATRAAVKGLKLELFASRPGNVLTSVKTPEGVDGEKLVTELRDNIGVGFAGGQDEMKGKLFRIAHLGYMDRFDITTAIAALEFGLKRQGFNVKLGDGVAAAEEILWKDPS